MQGFVICTQFLMTSFYMHIRTELPVSNSHLNNTAAQSQNWQQNDV